MTALIIIASIIGALVIITWVLGIVLFVKQKKAFEQAGKEADAEREQRRKHFKERTEQMDKQFEDFRNRNNEEGR